jgi:hypothetical protein
MLRKNIFLIYCVSLLFLGLGYLGFQPIFEGFDETAHYSSIRQMADIHTIPLFGSSYLDQAVLHYQGPQPYRTDNPPYDWRFSYNHFFKNQEWIKSYGRIYRNNTFHSQFQNSTIINWEAQHPPFYYFITAQFSHFISDDSFTTQFFILRLFSYLFALTGVILGLISIRFYPTTDQRAALLGFLFYPFLLPMFFPEFARLGNDSLCIFLVGL